MPFMQKQESVASIPPNNNIDRQKKTPIVHNSIQTQMGSIIDLFPTLCDIANVSISDRYIIDGFKLNNQISGKYNNKRHERFLDHFSHKHRYELFKLKNNPFKSHKLADENPK